MPNYHYKCENCGHLDKVFLPISFDPNKKLPCERCVGFMNRTICSPSAFKGFRVFAGDWFKKTYGHEIGEDGESAAEAKRDFEKFANDLKKEAGDIF